MDLRNRNLKDTMDSQKQAETQRQPSSEVPQTADDAPFSWLKAAFTVTSYLYFFFVFLLLGAFQINLSHHFPQYLAATPFSPSVDFGNKATVCAGQSMAVKFMINLAGLGVFAVHHSTFARTPVKRFLINKLRVPADIERSIFVLVTSAIAHLSMANWCNFSGLNALWGDSGLKRDLVSYSGVVLGMLVVLLSTFMIDHFDLFGLRQGIHLWPRSKAIVSRGFYQFLRHPIMTGFLIMFWARPLLTIGSLEWNVLCTGYIIIGTVLEEYFLILEVGRPYVEYKREKQWCGLIPGCPFGIPVSMAERMIKGAKEEEESLLK
eukprot:GEMP01039627.1.p1 GENE.GEMP01039627.1~~GEMP01039627.1.p1  ORF type:complete len:320 (+),score=49.41 GEMP01039627.1:1-960(+)